MTLQECKRKDVRTPKELWGSNRKTGAGEAQRRVPLSKFMRGMRFQSQLAARQHLTEADPLIELARFS